MIDQISSYKKMRYKRNSPRNSHDPRSRNPKLIEDFILPEGFTAPRSRQSLTRHPRPISFLRLRILFRAKTSSFRNT